MKRYQVAMVTGASAGLGEEFARQLAGCCRRLVLVARRGERLERLAAELRGRVPALGVQPIVADLARADDRLRLIEDLLSHGVVPDLLVNNAGLGDRGEFSTAEWPRIEAMLRVNIEALTHLTHALLPGMLRNGGGAVINVSSLAGDLPIPDFAVYAASKAYVSSFSEALRLELRGTGVPVLAVCPGPVHTEFGRVAAREGHDGSALDSPEWFYVDRRRVVDEALRALGQDRARVYPGLRIAAAAALIGLLPLCAVRLLMGRRPRRR